MALLLYRIGSVVPDLVHCTHDKTDKSRNGALRVHKGVAVRKVWQPMDAEIGEEARTVPESDLPCPVQVLHDRQRSETD
jgi:hypothetical protein